MWCVKVETGAFVARTPAGVFVTGNSGFCKAGDIGKQIDKAAGAKREFVAVNPNARETQRTYSIDGESSNFRAEYGPITAPATEAAKRWTGWHSQLAPGHEQWLIARKPTRLTYAKQVQTHGCGAFNIGATRIPRGDGVPVFDHVGGAVQGTSYGERAPGSARTGAQTGDSMPRNVTLTRGGGQCPVERLDRLSGDLGKSAGGSQGGKTCFADSPRGASRFFTQFPPVETAADVGYFPKARDRKVPGLEGKANKHPTHKHVALMHWLCKLMGATAFNTGDLPAVVLDPFNGSGTTGVGAMLAGLRYIGIEQGETHVKNSRLRINEAAENPSYYDKQLKRGKFKKKSKKTKPTG